MNNNATGIYGRGWAFPPKFTLDGVVMVQDQEDIRQSLKILFSTTSGERVMRPSYGCDLNAVMFENLTEDLLSSITQQITDSILRYEPRVVVTSVQVAQNKHHPSQLDVNIIYQIRGSDMTGQLDAQLDTGDGQGVSFP